MTEPVEVSSSAAVFAPPADAMLAAKRPVTRRPFAEFRGESGETHEMRRIADAVHG